MLDELTSLIDGFHRRGREGERQMFLRGADGQNKSFSVDRKGSGNILIPRVTLGMISTIQPGPLARIRQEATDGSDGFLERFQVFVAPRHYPEFNASLQDAPRNPVLFENMKRMWRRVLAMTPQTLGLNAGESLTFNLEAQMIFNNWREEWERMRHAPTLSAPFRSHLAKQNSTFARLALIFHVLEVAAAADGADRHPHASQVSAASALLAREWCLYLTEHARYLWGMNRRQDVIDARRVGQLIQQQQIESGTTTASDLRKRLSNKQHGMNADRLNAALQVLSEVGMIRLDKQQPAGSQGGRPSTTLLIHPEAHLVKVDDVDN